MTDRMSVSDIDDNWYALPESVKFTLWVSASSAAMLYKGEYLKEWINIIENANTTLRSE